VILPASNIDNLMLRDDVTAAVAAGGFDVHAVRTVDEAMEILTGEPSSAREADGRFSTETVHHRIDERLRALAETLRAFDAPPTSRQNGHVGRVHAR
jgi:predicted ATP-dependent protease